MEEVQRDNATDANGQFDQGFGQARKSLSWLEAHMVEPLP
jgi:hypothetical protein